MKLKVFIAGQKQIALMLFKKCLNDNVTVIGCCCPEDDKYLRPYAASLGYNVCSPKELAPDIIKGADVGFCAHYFGKISGDLINATRLGWLGYHPSLLPRHKGKNSIIDTINSGDKFAGGTLYWLNSGMDDGDIAYQDFYVLNESIYDMPKDLAIKRLWIDYLSPLGLSLFECATHDLKRGIIRRLPQEIKYAG